MSCMLCVIYENIVIILVSFYLKYYKILYENTYYLKQYILDQLSDLVMSENEKISAYFLIKSEHVKITHVQQTWR